MRALFLIPLMLASCSQAEEEAEAPAIPVTGSLAGLYERAGADEIPDRICIGGTSEDLRFGLVTQGDGPSNCTARGSVQRTGATLALRIDGAPACTLSATTIQAGLALGTATGAECAYYCGANAQLTPGAFVKIGARPTDIRKTVDVAGDPLC